MKIVVAIGGNALITPGGTGDFHDQFALSRKMARPLADLVEHGWQVTITHGNGPQVGTVIRRVEIAARQVYPIDLGLAVSQTQGEMGYMISQTLRNELHNRGMNREVWAVVTSVLVDAHDPAFEHPSKPIGPFLSRETAEHHRREDGWLMIEDAGRGYRRVVPSPIPLRVIEMPLIKHLVDSGELLLAGGGGGIPIVENEKGEYHGVEAVIDKDLTAAIIAVEVGADVLAIITGIECVYLNFQQPDQKALRNINIADLEALIREGHFPEGSMLPKIRAAIRFLKNRNAPTGRAVITDWSDLPAALEGQTGTIITL